MRRILLVVLIMLVGVSLALAQSVVYPIRAGESKPLSEIAKNIKPGKFHKISAGDREVPNRPSDVVIPPGDDKEDPVWQRQGGENASAPILVIEGISSDDNAAAFGFRVMPPDVNGDVGPNHIVEMVNLLFRIWNKSGTPLIPPTKLEALWAGFGGNCEFNNDGDPIVFYDHLNDRWVLSQFAFSVSQCVACSKTGDPTGAYWLYEFSTPGNDYPKMSVMPGGTYYGTIRNFSGAFKMDAHAWNGAKIRVGDPTAEMIVRTMTGVTGIDGVMPADLDGPVTASSPGIFVGHDDAGDRLYKYEMVPDFPTPGNTTFTGPVFISVPAYSAAFAGGFFAPAIPQPGTTQKLDVLPLFVKFATHYRDFGTHQTLIVNHAVDIQDFVDHAGERWYELRKVGAGAYTLFQSGSYAPDANHRWMGNAAMDKNGAIGLGYSVSSSTVSPSVRYTGRAATDPAGQMTLAEGVIAAGTGSQLGGSRWGDYSRMTVDPSDDETFWYFGEYVQATGSFEWNTKIGSFKVVSGPPPPYTARINSGGPNFTTGGGTLFVADKAYVAGNFGFVGGLMNTTTPPIGGTTDDGLYQSIRRSATTAGSSFQYNFDVPAGTFSVTLHMSAPAVGAGNFVMTVQSEGVNVPSLTNFDVNVQAGGTNIALIRSFSQVVSDGTLNLNFLRVNKTSLVGAIEVVQTAGPSTGKDSPAQAIEAAGVPTEFQLSQNYPNPFNPTTRISYQLPRDTRVTLKIYNLKGEEVRTLFDGHRPAGRYEVEWNAQNNFGARVASGIYLYQLKGDGVSEVRRMVLLQ